MTEEYKGHRVVVIQRKAPISDVPIEPVYKGLPRVIVEKLSDLAWMLDAQQADITSFGSDPGEFVWVLAQDWDRWRADQAD